MPQPSHIVFIHGLSNKPAPQDLRRIWLEALALSVNGDPGFDLGAVGVEDTFLYWADLFYDKPLPAAQYESRKDELAQSVDEEVYLPDDEWTRKMEAKLVFDIVQPFADAPVDPATAEYERIPIPWVIKKQVIKHFLLEAHHYLFNVNGIRDTIRERVMEALGKIGQGTQMVLVGHSLGSIIAYDVLTGLKDCPQVQGLLTLGSPLGIDEVQDKLIWTRKNGFPSANLQGDWVNVYDPYDVVARLDPRIANDFKQEGKEVVLDVHEENWGTWRHSATKYLKGLKLRRHLRQLAGRD